MIRAGDGRASQRRLDHQYSRQYEVSSTIRYQNGPETTVDPTNVYLKT